MAICVKKLGFGSHCCIKGVRKQLLKGVTIIISLEEAKKIIAKNAEEDIELDILSHFVGNNFSGEVKISPEELIGIDYLKVVKHEYSHRKLQGSFCTEIVFW